MKDLINKSFLNRSRGSADNNDNQDNYMKTGKVSYNDFDEDNEKREKGSLLTDNYQMADQEHIDIDY